jgi:hypothetical protein
MWMQLNSCSFMLIPLVKAALTPWQCRWQRKRFAPPAAPLRVTDLQPAQHYVIIELPVGWGGAVPHPAPGRHLFLCLSGSFQVTASSSETRSFATGDGLLLEDISGKGHTTVVTSNEPVRAVMIRLA